MALKTYKDKVKVILEKYEKARNNDGTLLAFYIWEYMPHMIGKDQDGEPCIRLSNIKHLPPIENLRRSRQIIQNDLGLFPPTDPKVCKARKIKEENWRNAEVREAKQS